MPENPPDLTPEAASRLVAALESPLEAADEAQRPPVDAPPGYTILGRIGAGSGGIVYLALREGSERPLALKILSRALNDGPGAQRAWRELEILSQLRLPSIPRVIDYGVHAGRLFIAAEHVQAVPLDLYCQGDRPSPVPDGGGARAAGGGGTLPSPTPPGQARTGGSLADSHPHAPLPFRGRIALLARIADAVQSLHEHGVIHRDLKPSNILVDRHGDPIIIDLGIASLITDDATQSLTSDGVPIGTPAFMSPEQARGRRSEISTRSDVYGLGATACQVLTGQTPHNVDTYLHEAVRRVAEDEPRDPCTLDPSLPRPIGAVLAKAIAPDPARRYASAGDFAADLRRWLRGEPVEAHPPGPWRKAWRWLGRHPVLTTAAACIALAAGILGGTALSVQWLYAQPHHVIISEDGRVATLFSRAGAPLHEWHSDIDRGIHKARMIDRPRELGGGQVIVTAMFGLRDAPPWDDQLAVWDPRRLDEPIWYTPRDDPTRRAPRIRLPPQTSRDLLRIEPQEEEYRAARTLLVADVFPNSAGPEIVVVYNHPMIDPTCIRIFDLAGNTLFEAWHWGGVNQPLWLPKPRLLVLAGVNNEYPWEKLGEPQVRERWPRVVLAIRPEFGAHRQWVNPRMAAESEAAVWYRCLLPPEATAMFRPRLLPTPEVALRGDHVVLSLVLEADRRAAVDWRLDEHGQIAHTQPGDPYRDALARGEVSHYDSLYLDGLPEPVERAGR